MHKDLWLSIVIKTGKVELWLPELEGSWAREPASSLQLPALPWLDAWGMKMHSKRWRKRVSVPLSASSSVWRGVKDVGEEFKTTESCPCQLHGSSSHVCASLSLAVCTWWWCCYHSCPWLTWWETRAGRDGSRTEVRRWGWGHKKLQEVSWFPLGCSWELTEFVELGNDHSYQLLQMLLSLFLSLIVY